MNMNSDKTWSFWVFHKFHLKNHDANFETIFSHISLHDAFPGKFWHENLLQKFKNHFQSTPIFQNNARNFQNCCPNFFDIKKSKFSSPRSTLDFSTLNRYPESFRKSKRILGFQKRNFVFTAEISSRSKNVRIYRIKIKFLKSGKHFISIHFEHIFK